MLFAEFSSAFNTIIIQHLVKKRGWRHPFNTGTRFSDKQASVCGKHLPSQHWFSSGVCPETAVIHPDDTWLLCLVQITSLSMQTIQQWGDSYREEVERFTSGYSNDFRRNSSHSHHARSTSAQSVQHIPGSSCDEQSVLVPAHQVNQCLHFSGGWKGCIWVQMLSPPPTEAQLRVCMSLWTELQTKREECWGQLRGLSGSRCHLLRVWPNNAAYVKTEILNYGRKRTIELSFLVIC